jgi:hypothetical protein
VKKLILPAIVALAATTLLAQDASKFNGTWKGSDNGQIRKLTYKDGVVHMEETQANGRLILRDYPAQGQEITMAESFGVWAGSKATGKMEGNKLSVDTTMPNGTKWHDEWTVADDGKSYSALRQNLGGGPGFGGGGARGAGGAPGAGAPGGAPPAAGAGGGEGRGPGGEGAAGGRARGGGGGPETFTKIE